MSSFGLESESHVVFMFSISTHIHYVMIRENLSCKIHVGQDAKTNILL